MEDTTPLRRVRRDAEMLEEPEIEAADAQEARGEAEAEVGEEERGSG